MPTFQNILSLEKLSLTIFSSSAPVLSSVSSFSFVFSSVMLLLPLSAASTPFCFSQNSDFKILDGCLKVLKYKSMKKCFIVCNTSSIVLLEGNLADTGLIAFMTRNFQLSTYLKTNCRKPHKVPVTLASAKKSMHTCCLLIALCSFFLFRSFHIFSL